MRTTLSIDDDVLYAAKSLARREGRSVGEVLSDLARTALQAPVPSAGGDTAAAPLSALDAELAALGLTPYRAPGVPVVTQDQIESLREAEGV
jgi:uncharacterized protein YgbK (DUF1537 family)